MEIVILSIVRGKWEHAWSFQWTEVSVFKSTTSWFLSRYRACDSLWLLDFFVVYWNEKWDWDRRIDIGTKNIGQKILKKKKKKNAVAIYSWDGYFLWKNVIESTCTVEYFPCTLASSVTDF